MVKTLKGKSGKSKSGKNKSGKSMKKISSSSNVENVIKYIKSLKSQEIKGFKKQAKELHTLFKNDSLVNALKGKNNIKSKQQGGALPILAAASGLVIPVTLIWGLCACCKYIEKKDYEQYLAEEDEFGERIRRNYRNRSPASSSSSDNEYDTPPALRAGRAQYFGNA